MSGETSSETGLGDLVELIARLRGGDVRALARAISVVEDRAAGAEVLLEAVRPSSGEALRVGVTGAPGVGKSTLVDRMAQLLVERGKSVGVVAVDPTSPETGGALLGDRIRMQGEGVFIRSMASRGALGGVASAVSDVCGVMAAAGRDVLLIETVGVGQAEVEVARLADVTVLVLAPGMGDEVQSMKAGVMEVADVYAVNKADRGGAEEVEAGILAMQGVAAAAGSAAEWVAPVVRCSAMTGEGIRELIEAVERSVACKKDRRSVREVLPKKRGLRLDHLGVAVKSITAARQFYEELGMLVAHEETVEHEQVRVAMLPVGETRVELLEATSEDSVIAKFVAKRGEGLHHVAVAVEDVDASFRQMKERGVHLASDAVRVGAGGHRYFFVHPKSTGGVLVEIVGQG